MAEARACERVVWFAKELGFRVVQIEGDSLITIKKLQLKTLDRSCLGPIIADIKMKKEFFCLDYLQSCEKGSK